MKTMTEDVPHAAFLQLLLACIDNDEVRAHEIIEDSNAVALAHHTAQMICLFVEDQQAWRGEIEDELRQELARLS